MTNPKRIAIGALKREAVSLMAIVAVAVVGQRLAHLFFRDGLEA